MRAYVIRVHLMDGRVLVVSPDPDATSLSDIEKEARRIARKGVQAESSMSVYRFIAPAAIHTVTVDDDNGQLERAI